MMNTLIRALVVAAAPLVATAQTAWDLPTGYAVNTFHVQNLQQFADDVNKASAGKLKVTLHPGGSLYKANEIKRAVQSGQVPAGEMILSGSANENPLFGVDSIPFLATSYADAKRLYLASKPVQEKALLAQGMKALYSVPWPGQSLYSLKPINSPGDLAGSKMRAYNPATSRIAQLLKAQPVTIQLAELPQALATGAVQTFLTSSAGGIESKLYEQVKYFYPVNAWLPRNVTVVSQKAFDALDPATKEAVLKAAAAAEERGWALSERLDGEYVRDLGVKGMSISPVSAAVKKELEAVGATMTAEWLKSAGPEGKLILDAYMKQ
jgi:TRAP-type C4-dicarboxylate transport system substrate-binding protein